MTRARGAAGRWQPPATLPPLYGPWIAELLGGALPAEPEATCENCAMCAPAGGQDTSRLALLDALVYFDGRPTKEALRRIGAERRLNLQPDLVRRLVDFGVLIEAAPVGAG